MHNSVKLALTKGRAKLHKLSDDVGFTVTESFRSRVEKVCKTHTSLYSYRLFSPLWPSPSRDGTIDEVWVQRNVREVLHVNRLKL